MIRTTLLAIAIAIALIIALTLACAAGDLQPARPDASASCAACRMMVSDLRFAGQLVAAGEEPRFFDDIGCMRNYLAAHRTDAEWRAFVTDYRTREWVAIESARFWNCNSIATPMASHIVAASRKPAGDCTPMTEGLGK